MLFAMMRKIIITLVVLAAIVVARYGYIFKALIFASREKFDFDDKDCELAGIGVGLIGSEDMALGRHGVLFISSGDLGKTFKDGASAANPGHIWVLNMRGGGSPKPVKAIIYSFPKDLRFQPHGIDVSNSTDKLYVVSHNDGYSSVIVLNIQYNDKCIKDADWKCQEPVVLTFDKDIESNLFPHMGLNDVVEASDHEVYVTQWLPFSWPKRGMSNPDSFDDYVNVVSNFPLLVLLFGYKWTTVFHCSWEKGQKAFCNVATEETFVMANGVTISPDKKTVFVNDPLQSKVTAMTRDVVSGKLTKKSEIETTMVDNIEYDDEANEIIMGNILPGGMTVLRQSGENWVTSRVLKHNEEKLKQISAASRLGSRIVLGSPFSEGILVCSI